LDSADYLVVPGAPAEIAGEPVSDVVLRWIWIAVEQRLGRDDEARRADATLERGIFKEALLNGMQAVRFGDAFDGGDISALGFDTKHAARIHQAAVHDDIARAAVAVVAAFLRTSEFEIVSQNFEEAVAGFAKEIDLFTVDGCLNVNFLGHGEDMVNG
jgi:hypothetical protein